MSEISNRFKFFTNLESNSLQNLESNHDRNRDDPAKDQKCDCELDKHILVLGGD